MAGPDGGQWAHGGQLSPGVSCPQGGSRRRGWLSGGELSGGQLSGGELLAHPHMGSFHVKIHYINILSIQ